MNTNDLAKFTELLTTVSALYRTPLSGKSMELYWNALQGFDWTDVKTAFQRHLIDPDTGQYFPKPADVARHLQGGSETQALKAWSKVDEAIHCVGCYASVVFDDPIIHVVIDDMGGWIRLCQTLLKDLPFRANEFKKHYVAYVNHPVPHYPKQLIGLEEQQNRMRSYATQPPLLIGDQKQALAVLEHGCEKFLNVHALDMSLAMRFSLGNRCNE